MRKNKLALLLEFNPPKDSKWVSEYHPNGEFVFRKTENDSTMRVIFDKNTTPELIVMFMNAIGFTRDKGE
jgi:hypothetical protein